MRDGDFSCRCGFKSLGCFLKQMQMFFWELDADVDLRVVELFKDFLFLPGAFFVGK